MEFTEWKRLALFLYVLLIPITFPFQGLEGIKTTLKMAWRALTQRPFVRLEKATSRPSVPRRSTIEG